MQSTTPAAEQSKPDFGSVAAVPSKDSSQEFSRVVNSVRDALERSGVHATTEQFDALLTLTWWDYQRCSYGPGWPRRLFRRIALIQVGR